MSRPNILTEEQQSEVCTLTQSGASIDALMKRFKCGETPIRNARRRGGILLSQGKKDPCCICRVKTVTNVNPYTGCLTLSDGSRVIRPAKKWTVGDVYVGKSIKPPEY